MGHYLSEMEPDFGHEDKFVCAYCKQEFYKSDKHSCVPYLIQRIEKLEQLTDALLKAIRWMGGPL